MSVHDGHASGRSRRIGQTLAASLLVGALIAAPVLLVAGAAQAAPLAPSIVAPSADFTYDGASFHVVGSNGEAGDNIGVFLDSTKVCDFTALSAAWSCDIPAITVGAHSIYAQQTDLSSATTAGPTVNFAVTAAQPSINATPSSADSTQNFTISGTGVNGGQIALSAVIPSTVALCGAITVGVGGNWSCDVAAGTLGVNMWQLLATQTAGGGTADSPQSPLQITVPVPTPTIGIVAPVNNTVILDTSVTVSGTTTNAPVGATVYVSAVETPACSAVVQPDGTWTCDLAGLSSFEDFNISASYVDGGTADATATVSVLLPPTVTGSGVDGGGNVTLHETPGNFTMSGSAYATQGTQIGLSIQSGTAPAIPCTTNTDASGAWSCVFSAVPAGTYTATLSQQPPWSTVKSNNTGSPKNFLLSVDSYTEPVLNCTYTPGDVTVSTANVGVRLDLYLLASGGGAVGNGHCNGATGTGGTVGDYLYYGYCADTSDGSGQTYLGSISTGCDLGSQSAGGVLKPGLWSVAYQALGPDQYGPYFHYLLRIPEQPRNFALAGSDFSGSGTYHDTVTVTGAAQGVICSATVDAGGAWSCSVADGPHAPGPIDTTDTFSAFATDPDSGGISANSTLGAAPTVTVFSEQPNYLVGRAGDSSYQSTLTLDGSINGTIPSGEAFMTGYFVDAAGQQVDGVCGYNFSSATWGCTFSPGATVQAGTYPIQLQFTVNGAAVAYYAVPTVTVYGPPTVNGAPFTVEQNGILHLTGGKITDHAVSVTVVFPDDSTQTLSLCNDAGTTDNTWDCTWDLSTLSPVLPIGSYDLQISQQLYKTEVWVYSNSVGAVLKVVADGTLGLAPTVDYTLVSPDFLHEDAHGTTAVLPHIPGDGLSIQRFDYDLTNQSATFAETCTPTATSGSALFNDNIDSNGKYWFPCSTGAGPGPGVTQMRIGQSLGGAVQFAPYDYILEPVAPTAFTTQVNPDLSVTISGQGLAPGTGVQSTGVGPSATTYGVTVWEGVQYAAPEVCDATTTLVAADGTWACTIANPGAGDHTYIAAQRYISNWNPTLPAGSGSTYSALSIATNPSTVTLVTPGAPSAPTPTPSAPAPSPAPTPPPLVWILHSNSDKYEAGDSYQFWSEGLPPGAAVDAEIHSTPTHLGSTVVGADGKFLLTGKIPESVEPGKHTVIVTVTPVGQVASPQVRDVTVIPHAVTKVTPPRLPHTGAGTGTADRSDPTALSSFTASLITLRGIMVNPLVIGLAFLGALALFLLVAFPAELLNSTFSEQYERFTRWIPGAKKRPAWLVALGGFLERTPVAGGIILTVIASIIFSFADPEVGFDLVTFRVIMACIIALFIVGYLANTIAGGIVGRRFGLDLVMELKPLALILTVVGVIMSRLLNFTPGFLIGLLLGVAILGRPTKGQAGKASLIKAGIVWAFGIVAWLAYSVLLPILEGSGFAGNLTLETLGAISAEGLTALLVGMLPFTFLEGASIWAWNKLAWVGSYILFAFSFCVIVLPGGWRNLTGSIWVWGSIAAAFALACIGIYLYFRFLAKPLEEEETEPELETEGERV
jgi:hypothetical protein